MSEEKKEESLYSKSIREAEATARELERTAWRSASGNDPIRFRNDDPDAERIDYRVLLKDPNVKAGLITMFLGLGVAALAFVVDVNKTWQMIICLGAATLSTAGAKSIENAINEVGYKEVKEMNDYNRSRHAFDDSADDTAEAAEVVDDIQE